MRWSSLPSTERVIVPLMRRVSTFRPSFFDRFRRLRKDNTSAEERLPELDEISRRAEVVGDAVSVIELVRQVFGVADELELARETSDKCLHLLSHEVWQRRVRRLLHP